MKPVCFMVMPFGIKEVLPPVAKAPEKIDFDALWNKALAPLISELGYEPVRADQDVGALIIHEMLERLYFSDLVIADMTIPNGNVYYEVGIRHACKRNGCVLIGADWSRPLFDVDQMRRLTYPLAEGIVTDASAVAITAALRAGLHELARGDSPIYQVIPGFPDPAKVDPNRANAIKEQLTRLSAFQTRVREARLSPDRDQGRRLALALQEELPATVPMTRSVALEMVMLLRDCAGWQEAIDYIDALPGDIQELELIKEQRCLARAKTGDNLAAIAALTELIQRSGDSSERQGLIGGRYKKLATQALKEGNPQHHRGYLDQAIDHYERGMSLDLNDYYPTCNLPRLYRERNEEGDADKAALTARIALLACERAKEHNQQDEWLKPTLLGMAFDAGDATAAKHWAKEVSREGPAAWKLDTTIADLERSVRQAAAPTTQRELTALLAELRTLL